MSLSVSQFIRLISIIAVIVIHGSYQYQMNFRDMNTANLADWIGVFLNQLARFSVPIFVFLSGYGLSIKFHSNQNQPFLSFVKDFYLNRMSRIGVPFIVWTLIFLFVSHKIGYFAEIGILGSILKSIQAVSYTIYFTGADYHFYFFTIILWCYLFFPFLIYIVHNSSKPIVVS
ncbi:MAG: acyltransferase family protein [Leptonema sp. (in: Bacteria)]|nr:acyltransferase family protein [Leptonema sp. (in: bacteria)]